VRIENPIVELHKTRLYKRLSELSEDYAQRITDFLSEIAPLLAGTRRFFPYYTRHDANHGYRVIRRIEQVLLPNCLKPNKSCTLGATEIFLLIASAYAHDLGMSVFPGEEEELAKSLALSLAPGWETNPVLQAHLRKDHSARGGKYIAANADKLKVPINLIAPLDLMMRSHNFSIPELENNLHDPFAAEERVIDVRQLSIVLCIADAIEFSDTRVVDGVLELISRDSTEEARKSLCENMKHACISDGLAIQKDGRIVVSGTFSDPEVLSLAHHNLDQIEQWITGYCDIDRRSEIPRLLVRPEPLSRRLELSGARFWRLGVRMSKRNVIELISSNAVWQSNFGAPVRELIQNSVEACRYRNFHSAEADSYVPAISVTFNRSAKTITVKDNGCGMSERVILDHFLTVGNSRATERAYASESYAPIARFGIGFWSVFTIAERACIETLAFEESDNAMSGEGIQFAVELGDLKDYTVFSPKNLTAGTTVTLHLKPAIVLDEVFEQTQRQLLCSEIEITLALDDDRSKIPITTPTISDEYLLQAKFPRKKELGIETFKWSGSLGNTELAMGLVYRISNGRATFVDDSSRQMMFGLGPPGPMLQPRTAICGFQVGARSGSKCFDVTRVGTYFANYATPRGIEFSIDRQRLQATEASRRFESESAQLAHTGYREFLKTVGALNEESIFELNAQSRMSGGEVPDTFTGSELADAYSNYPDLLCFKLWPVWSAKDLRNSSPEFLDLNSLSKRSGIIWVIQNHYMIPVDGGKFASFYEESLLLFAYLYAKRRLQEVGAQEEMFVVESHRLASMVFDCDPDSTVEFSKALLVAGKPAVDICIQRISLGNVRFTGIPEGILAEVQGRWSGTIYLRNFGTPNGKPYVFLGRHRILVQKTSRLRSYLEGLKNEGRLIKLAETVALLKDDEAGFTPAALADML
jgi:Histidine kinase-, DNA gyrase B-, and HSP90-like ATPase